MLLGHLAEPIEGGRRRSAQERNRNVPHRPHGPNAKTHVGRMSTGSRQPGHTALPSPAASNQHRVAALTASTSAATQW
jgi:hypothetical protein